MNDWYRAQVEADTAEFRTKLAATSIGPEKNKIPAHDLVEFKNVDQKEFTKGVKRRWFLNAELTLIVWFDLSDAIIGFQLCYGLPGGDNAISWYNETESSHRTVDYGRLRSVTPILNRDAGKIDFAIFQKLYLHSGDVDQEILDFIRAREAILRERGK